MNPRVYYFGCESKQFIGHNLFAPGFDSNSKIRREIPWNYYEDLDGQLAPVLSPPGTYYLRRIEAPQGQVQVHHKDGWTALAFWDRSADGRGGSNSCFLIDRIVDFKEGIELAQASWPQLFKRFQEAGLELKEYNGA